MNKLFNYQIHKIIIKNNRKTIENYFSMVFLQILNSFFYFIIYPFLIRKLGPNSYGLYIFAMSIVNYFAAFVNFGFDMPAVKSISQNTDNKGVMSDTLSCVLTSKIYLMLIALCIFVVSFILFPTLRVNWVIFSVCFLNIFYNILFPQWYFQGIQKMHIVTIIQLTIKILSLPLIFFLIDTSNDVSIFASITIATNLLSAIIAVYIIVYRHNLKISFVGFNKVKLWIKDSFPFFWANSANTIKMQSTTLIIGIFFSLRDVALFDLAMKIFLLPVILLSNINSALFPKLVKISNSIVIKKVIKYETILGFIVIIFLFVFGKLIINLLGGHMMHDAYPLLVILSFSVFTMLTVGAICSFIFVPLGKYKYIAYNQTFAFVGFFLFVFIGLLFMKNIIILPMALTFSSFIELLYCYFILKQQSKA